MNVIVTGGAGFIGSHFADALLERGHDVHILDDLSSRKRKNVPEEARLHVLDIRGSSVDGLLREEKYDVLIHHAAQMDVRASVTDPSFDADVNIRGFLNLTEAGRKK